MIQTSEISQTGTSDCEGIGIADAGIEDRDNYRKVLTKVSGCVSVGECCKTSVKVS